LEEGLCFGEKMEKKEEEEILKKIRKEEIGKTIVLGTFIGHYCCWELWARGPGNRNDS
jgi:hypothetical protein